EETAYRVGDDLIVSVADGQYEPTFRFFLPGKGVQRSELPIDATQSEGELSATLADVAGSGVYDVQLQPISGPIEQREYAFNVSAGEGDLAVVDSSVLAEQLAGLEYQLHDASEMTMSDE